MKEIKFIEAKIEEIKLPVVGDLLKCSVCKRKTLIERGLIGTNHTNGIFVTCWDCLTEEQKEKAKEKYKLKRTKKLPKGK